MFAENNELDAEKNLPFANKHGTGTWVSHSTSSARYLPKTLNARRSFIFLCSSRCMLRSTT